MQPTATAALGGDKGDEERIATAALMERFSFRERELLHELQTWKTRCEVLEDNIAGGSDESGGGQGDGGDGTGVRGHSRHALHLNGKDTCDAFTLGGPAFLTPSIPGGSAFLAPSLPAPAEIRGGVENIGPPTSRGGNLPISRDPRAETLDISRRNVGRGEADGREADAHHSASEDVRWVLVLFDLPPERKGDLELRRQDIIEVGAGVFVSYEIRAEGGGR